MNAGKGGNNLRKFKKLWHRSQQMGEMKKEGRDTHIHTSDMTCMIGLFNLFYIMQKLLIDGMFCL